MRRGVFLDRDGTINRAFLRDGKSYPPASLAEFELLPGADIAIRRLRDAGLMIVVVTNQPDVATGKQSRAVVDSMSERLSELVPIDTIRACYHVEADGCECRKPKPGLLLQAAAELDIELGRSFMVGDRWRDIVAGQAAGCFSIMLKSGPDEGVAVAPDAVASSLLEAADIILDLDRKRTAA
jgi:D-glycero-D-manno-heptose 1,7-bisphosphate phosphatase